MREFVGILPAGGTGSRLQPLKYPKELLPVCYNWSEDGRTIVPTLAIEHALRALQIARVHRCLVVVSDAKPEICRYLGDGTQWGVRLAYVVQHEPLGLANAVGQACQWLSELESNCCLVLPDTFFDPADALGLINEELISRRCDLVLGVFPTESPQELGPVCVAPDGAIEVVYDKPAITNLKNTWGVAAWTPRFSRLLCERLATEDGGRAILGDIFNLACTTELGARAIEFGNGSFHDIGTRVGLTRLVGAVQQSLQPQSDALRENSAQRRSGRAAQSSPGRRHLLVAVHDRSWGRTELALRVGDDLRAVGEEVVFLVNRAAAAMIEGAGFRCEIVANHLGGLTRLLFDACVRRVKPTSIIYFDFFTTSNYLLQMGIRDSQFLLNYDCTILTLDTWDFEQTGHVVDVSGESDRSLVFGDVREKIQEFSLIDHHLIPVPIARCEARKGQFNSLPPIAEYLDDGEWRQRLALSHGDRLILFCTSTWQHQLPTAHDGGMIARVVPRLVAEYVRALGPSVHLVHVGPEPYPVSDLLGSRYHWQRPLAPAHFEQLMRGTDLLISANVAASTITRAIPFGVPVLVLRNSHSFRDVDQLPGLVGQRVSSGMLALLSQAVPIDPFLVWPIGYHRFLHPLLIANPYCDAFETAEVFDEVGVVERCNTLLYDHSARDELADRQSRYEQAVRTLPSSADVVGSCCA